jgi:hypothetical protein
VHLSALLTPTPILVSLETYITAGLKHRAVNLFSDLLIRDGLGPIAVCRQRSWKT